MDLLGGWPQSRLDHHDLSSKLTISADRPSSNLTAWAHLTAIMESGFILLAEESGLPSLCGKMRLICCLCVFSVHLYRIHLSLRSSNSYSFSFSNQLSPKFYLTTQNETWKALWICWDYWTWNRKCAAFRLLLARAGRTCLLLASMKADSTGCCNPDENSIVNDPGSENQEYTCLGSFSGNWPRSFQSGATITPHFQVFCAYCSPYCVRQAAGLRTSWPCFWLANTVGLEHVNRSSVGLELSDFTILLIQKPKMFVFSRIHFTPSSIILAWRNFSSSSSSFLVLIWLFWVFWWWICYPHPKHSCHSNKTPPYSLLN